MENSLLQILANIAIIRQHINHIVNSTPNKKVINPIQKVAAQLDLEFTELLISPQLLSVNFNGDLTTCLKSVSSIKLESQEVELPDVSLPVNNVRPKVKTSNKKTNAPK